MIHFLTTRLFGPDLLKLGFYQANVRNINTTNPLFFFSKMRSHYDPLLFFSTKLLLLNGQADPSAALPDCLAISLALKWNV
jgi:hypothetical protein